MSNEFDQNELNELMKSGWSYEVDPNIPSGGSAGQVLAKTSSEDYDVEWVNPSGGGGGTGEPGAAATIEIGTVTEGDTPAVTNSGTENAAVLDFVLPAKKTVQIATVENGSVYSAEETVVGQWIDGKPIYRKVFQCVGPPKINVTSNFADLSELNIDAVVSLSVIGYRSGTETRVSVYPNPYLDIGYDHSTCQLVGGTTVSVEVNGVRTATIEYTKTTDEATVAVATVDELNAAYDEGVQST